MKINGVDPKTLPNVEVLVLPRGDQAITIKASGLKDMDEFNKLCPEPVPPGKLTRDGYVPDVNDPGYRSVMGEYQKKRLAYMVVKSLEPSNIEWESVNLDDPRTWSSWENDMKAAGLTQVECNRILNLVMEANCLDEAKLKKAREVFLLGPQPGSATSASPPTEQASTQSGAPASA